MSELELECPYCTTKARHPVSLRTTFGGVSKWRCVKCGREFG